MIKRFQSQFFHAIIPFVDAVHGYGALGLTKSFQWRKVAIKVKVSDQKSTSVELKREPNPLITEAVFT